MGRLYGLCTVQMAMIICENGQFGHFHWLQTHFWIGFCGKAKLSRTNRIQWTKWMRLMYGKSTEIQFDLYFLEFNFDENAKRWHPCVNQENAASAYVNIWTRNEAMNNYCWNSPFKILNICIFIISKKNMVDSILSSHTYTHISCCAVLLMFHENKWKRLIEVKSSDNWMRQHTVCFG